MRGFSDAQQRHLLYLRDHDNGSGDDTWCQATNVVLLAGGAAQTLG
jgi:hypothetical protein